MSIKFTFLVHSGSTVRNAHATFEKQIFHSFQDLMANGGHNGWWTAEGCYKNLLDLRHNGLKSSNLH